MKWSTVAAATLLMVMPFLFSSTAAAKDDKNITLRGCVQQGAKKGHYVLTRFSQVPPAGEAAMPKYAHGKRVFFWLEDLPKLDKHFSRMVEVKGEIISMKESESDPKMQDGQFVVEFEGPGRDVDLTGDQAREVVGTSGLTKMKTLLVRVDVDDVKEISGSCK